MKLEPNAPRFHALWEKREGRRIFIMKKDDWNSIDLSSDQPVALQLDRLESSPFDRIAVKPSFHGAVARRTGQEVKIAIYRDDPQDDPYLINVDKYTVWESFPPHIFSRRQEMIQTADTDADLNFQRCEQEHVFIVKEDPADDHWLEQLPSEVVALIQVSN